LSNIALIIDDRFKYVYFNIIIGGFMRIGGRCPLNHVKNEEEFLKKELQNFYSKQMKTSNLEEMRKEFCRSVCENIMC
jgi:DNA gyrase inhibitor GyrI